MFFDTNTKNIINVRLESPITDDTIKLNEAVRYFESKSSNWKLHTVIRIRIAIDRYGQSLLRCRAHNISTESSAASINTNGKATLKNQSPGVVFIDIT